MIAELAPGFVIGLLLWLIARLNRSSTQLQASEAQTQYLAFHDVLTALPNRALFNDRVERAMANARRSCTSIALMAVDIDRFKSVNDTPGHQAGDELIRQVAQRLVAEVRETDTVARLGGDEFAIVQTDVTSELEVEELAQRLVACMAAPFVAGGERYSLPAVSAPCWPTASNPIQEKCFVRRTSPSMKPSLAAATASRCLPAKWTTS